MNRFKKYCTNVWVAKCDEEYEKGEIIERDKAPDDTDINVGNKPLTLDELRQMDGGPLITEARELCEKATRGPWGSRIDVGKKYYVFTPSYGVRDFCCLSGGFEHESDAALVARSRTLIPELCDALEKAQAQNKQLMHEVCKLACESVEREKNLARLEAEVMAMREAQMEGENNG